MSTIEKLGEGTITVRLPRALTNLFQGARPVVALPGSTVGEVIDQLDARWPGMRDRLCDTSPAIRRHINVFVKGKRAALETQLAPGSEVIILTAISGG
ncbi:MAG: MoaD/ThiS family protein [Geminicoccaceae bacterium]